MGLEGEKRTVKLIFVLKTHGCWKNAVETSHWGLWGWTELFAGQKGGGLVCHSVSSSIQRVQKGKCLEKMVVKLSSAPHDGSFFCIPFALSRNWALNKLLKAKTC